MISKKRRLDLPPQHTLEDRAVTFITRPDADPPFATPHITFTTMALLTDTERKMSLSSIQYRRGGSGLGPFQRCLRN